MATDVASQAWKQQETHQEHIPIEPVNPLTEPTMDRNKKGGHVSPLGVDQCQEFSMKGIQITSAKYNRRLE